MEENNPYKLCIWKDPSECNKCLNLGRINCRFSTSSLKTFLIPSLSFMVFTFAGFIVLGIVIKIWWALIGYIIFLLFFFLIIETRILCSHCPYYSENSRVLRCYANYGLLKIWPYNPKPMNIFEKVSLVICFIIFGGFPVSVQSYGLWLTSTSKDNNSILFLSLIAISILTFISGVVFFVVLNQLFCPYCINFSCPFNRASKDIVNEFLKNNPLILREWTKC